MGSERFRGFGVQQFEWWVCGFQAYLRRGVYGAFRASGFFWGVRVCGVPQPLTLNCYGGLPRPRKICLHVKYFPGLGLGF